MGKIKGFTSKMSLNYDARWAATVANTKNQATTNEARDEQLRIILNIIKGESEAGFYEANTWEGVLPSVYDALKKMGYHITVVPNALNGVATTISWDHLKK